MDVNYVPRHLPGSVRYEYHDSGREDVVKLFPVLLWYQSVLGSRLSVYAVMNLSIKTVGPVKGNVSESIVILEACVSFCPLKKQFIDVLLIIPRTLNWSIFAALLA